MSNFTRVKALGWSLGEVLTSFQMNQLDINVSKAVNGDDGGSWAGAVILTNGRLQGTSFVNTSGQLTTTGAVTGGTVQSSTGDITSAADLIATSALKSPIALADKHGPRTISEQSVHSVSGGASASVTLDLTSYDTFIVNVDSDVVDAAGVLGTITLTTASGDADREVKKGAHWSLTVRANGHAGGVQIASAAWPASIVGLGGADKIGPGPKDGNDTMTYVFRQVGTPGVPKFVPVSAVAGAT